LFVDTKCGVKVAEHSIGLVLRKALLEDLGRMPPDHDGLVVVGVPGMVLYT
jgi:hypothetical protein